MCLHANHDSFFFLPFPNFKLENRRFKNKKLSQEYEGVYNWCSSKYLNQINYMQSNEFNRWTVIFDKSESGLILWQEWTNYSYVEYVFFHHFECERVQHELDCFSEEKHSCLQNCQTIYDKISQVFMDILLRGLQINSWADHKESRKLTFHKHRSEKG